jgi:hypothetical protein
MRLRDVRKLRIGETFTYRGVKLMVKSNGTVFNTCRYCYFVARPCVDTPCIASKNVNDVSTFFWEVKNET